MSAPIVLLSCALAVMIQNVYGECSLRNSYNVGSCCGSAYKEYPLPSPWRSNACGAGFESGVVPASDGGGFLVTSASPVPPSGVSVLSENEYAGILAVAGQVPFLGTAYLEGAVPSAGNGAVTYGCGYDEVAIVSEEGSAPGSLSGTAFAHYPGAVSPWVADIGCNGLRPCGCAL